MTTDPIYPVPQYDTTYGQITGEPYGTPPPATDPAPSWGIPPSQTNLANAAWGTQQVGVSVLQSLLEAAGLWTPPPPPMNYGLPAPTGGDNFTQSFLTGVDAQQRQQAAATGQSTFDLSNDRVYMGHTTTSDVADVQHIGLPGATDSDLAAGPKSETTHNTTTVQAALNQPYLWSEDKRSEVMKKMREAGYNITTFAEAFGDGSSGGLWQQLVVRASRSFVLSNGENLVTPWDMLSADKKENIANGTLDKNGHIVSVSKSTSVNDLTEGQAWQVLRGTVQDMLGKDPSDQDVRDFLSSANADAARDPSHTVTTTKTDTETGDSHSSSVTHGGYTEADAAKTAYDETHDSAEYADYQSAGTIFNWIQAALGEVAGSQ